MAVDCIEVDHRVVDDKVAGREAVGNLEEVDVDNQVDNWDYSSTFSMINRF